MNKRVFAVCVVERGVWTCGEHHGYQPEHLPQQDGRVTGWLARFVADSCLVPRGSICSWQQVKQQWVVIRKQIVAFFTIKETNGEKPYCGWKPRIKRHNNRCRHKNIRLLFAWNYFNRPQCGWIILPSIITICNSKWKESEESIRSFLNKTIRKEFISFELDNWR